MIGDIDTPCVDVGTSRADTADPVPHPRELGWVREPQQTRSARTRAQLLDATAALLDEEGLESLTIAKVAKSTGCAVGTLYHHFQDKQTIVRALIVRFSNEMRLTAREILKPGRWEHIGLMGVIESYVRFTLELYRRFPGTLKAQQMLMQHDQEVSEHYEAAADEAYALLVALLRPRLREITHPQPDMAIEMILAMVKAVLVARASGLLPRAIDSYTDDDEEQFVEELMRMAAAYLGADARPDV
ncbi:MAG: TetR/AcrR family transcriptional regulator [Pseudomonadota bacterium]